MPRRKLALGQAWPANHTASRRTREHVQRAHAALDRAAIAARAIEQPDDLGAPARIDVDDQRRDVREHEVEAEARARLIDRLRAAALVAGAAHVIDHVALTERAATVAD